MPLRSFPPTTRRAKRPFELIHSDLKQFPIESYRHYRYIITFFDDYSSHAWITCLRTKGAAISATKQFLAMVENQLSVGQTSSLIVINGTATSSLPVFRIAISVLFTSISLLYEDCIAVYQSFITLGYRDTPRLASYQASHSLE